MLSFVRLLVGCVINQDIDLSELFNRALGNLPAMILVTNVSGTAIPARPLSRTRSTVCSASECSLRYEISTSAPSRAYASATARPIPLSPPVMIAAFPLSFMPSVGTFTEIRLGLDLRFDTRPLLTLLRKRWLRPLLSWIGHI
jgi:hypothetical protein